MSIPKHIKEHLALGFYGLSGSNVYTVGSGGRFSTLDSALAFFAGLTGSDVMSEVPGMTGTVTVTQNSDVVTGSGTNFLTMDPRDYIQIDGDGGGFGSFIATDVKHTIWQIRSNTSLRLATGFVGASGGSKAYSVFRPVHYTLVLLPGEHDITVERNLPLGLSLSIIGLNKTACILNVGQTLNYPRTCRLSVENCTVEHYAGLLWDFTDVLGVLDCGFGAFKLENIICAMRGDPGTSPAIAQPRGSSLVVRNVYGSVNGAITAHMADYILYENVVVEGWNGGADIIQCSLWGAHSATKPWIIRNVECDRRLADTSGAGAVIELNMGGYSALAATKEARLTSAKIIDRDQGGSANPGCIQVHITPSIVYLDDVVIDNTGGAGAGLRVGGANATVYANNVRQLNGQPPPVTITSGAYYNLNAQGSRAIAYAATVTPNANLGKYHDIGALTGNIEIAAPTSPMAGQELCFVFEQDGTGGWAITWDAVFSKTADPTPGTAGQKASTSFRYDGAEWVQIGGALAWA